MSYVRVYLVAAIAVWAICSVIIAFSCQCETNTAPAEPQRNLAKRNDGAVAKTPSQTTYLLVMIMSGPEETQRRQTIRETWLKLSTKGPAVFIPFFPIGTKKLDIGIVEKLRQENEQTGDLALIDGLEEAYSNLAEKTLKSMVYAYENYNFKYILKHPRLYWGFLDGRAKPIRKGKWKENDWILCDRYLPYQLGGGYVLSYDLVRFLAINAPLFKLYKNEDVSVGAWLAGLDVKYVHDPRFDTEWISRGCSNQYLITHKKTAEEMRALFQSLKDRKVLCEKEFRSRNSYVYDWSAVPSKCCERLNGSSIP